MIGVVKESLRDIRRHKRAAVLLALVISSASFLFFVFSSAVYNLGLAEDNWSKQLRAAVFFVEGTDVKELSEQISKVKGVLEVKHISSELSLEILKKRFPDEDVVFSVDSVPGFIEARISADVVANISSDLQKIEGVEDVSLSSSWFKSLKDLIYFSALFSIGVMIFVMVLSTILVFYAVRIGVIERKDEIRLMRLCGATEFRIRIPYVVSGVVMGVFGASVGVCFQYIFGKAVDKSLSQFIDGWVSLTAMQVVFVYAVSIFIGCFGNLMAFVRSIDDQQ